MLRPLSLWHSANDTPALQRERISLHWACIQGHRAVVQTLLAHGANVAAIDEVSAACGYCAAGGCDECPIAYRGARALNLIFGQWYRCK